MNFTLGPWLILTVCVGVLGDDDIDGIEESPRDVGITRPTNVRVVTEVICNYQVISQIQVNKVAGVRGITLEVGGRLKYKLVLYPVHHAVRLYYVEKDGTVQRAPLLHVKVRGDADSTAVDASIDIKQENGKDKFIFYKYDGGVDNQCFMDHAGREDAVTICCNCSDTICDDC